VAVDLDPKTGVNTFVGLYRFFLSCEVAVSRFLKVLLPLSHGWGDSELLWVLEAACESRLFDD
jgi:hypothetical protein